MEVLGWGVDQQGKMGSDCAVLTSVGSSFQHCGTRTEKSLYRRGSQSSRGRKVQWLDQVVGRKEWSLSPPCKLKTTYPSLKHDTSCNREPVWRMEMRGAGEDFGRLNIRWAEALWTCCRGLMADAWAGVAVVQVTDDKQLDEHVGRVPSEEWARLWIEHHAWLSSSGLSFRV